MNPLRPIIAALLLTSALLCAQPSPVLELGGFWSAADSRLGLASGAGWEVALYLPLTGPVHLGVTAAHRATTSPVERPAGPAAVNGALSLLLIRVGTDHPLGSVAALAPYLAAGVARQSRDALTVDLGALGSRTLASRSDHHMVVRLAFPMRVPAAGRIRLFAGPVLDYRAADGGGWNGSLNGGIALAIR